MFGLGFEPWTAGWWLKTDPLSYGGLRSSVNTKRT